MALPVFPPAGGLLSPYLVGIWHDYAYAGPGTTPAPTKLETHVELLNPTNVDLDYRVVYFDDGGKAGGCHKGTIPANGFALHKVVGIDSLSNAGAIKVVSLEKGLKRARAGLVGYVRLTSFQVRLGFGGLPSGEEESGRAYMPLFQVPKEVLDEGELKIILAACP